MGRWVTSKGRRIYIPDEGEENPYAKGKTYKNHMGARIKVLDSDGKTVTYRITSNKDDNLDTVSSTSQDKTVSKEGFKAMTEKNGYKSQQSKDDEIKEKQIASNKAQADERNGSKLPARSQEEINSGKYNKYNKYKQGMAYKNAKTVQVNGKTYKVWGDTTYRGTFAEDEHGNVLPIMGSGYLTKELSQRKAIANKFGEETFRKNKKKGK